MSDIYFSDVTFIHMIVIIASHMYGLVLVNGLTSGLIIMVQIQLSCSSLATDDSLISGLSLLSRMGMRLCL